MKNKYMRLSKLERKQAIDDYRNYDDNKKQIYKRITRLKYIGIFGIIYAILNFGIDMYMDTINVWDYILDALLLIFCLVFVFKANDLLIEQVNKFLIEKGKSKK